MPELPPRTRSLWMATSSGTSYPRLAEELRVDVAVVGGGIAGITTALLCKEAGRSVAVLEADRVGTGATAHSTVKVTSGHGAKYQVLASTHGAEAARLYADANQSAVRRIAEHVTRLGIECDWEWKRHCMWADTPEEADLLRQELEAQRAAGLPVSFATDVDLPFPTEGAIQLDQQGQFHPQRYVAGIARHVSGAGSHVFERTRVNDVEVGEPCRVITDDAAVLATDVVIATHFPIVDPALILTRATPQMEYAVASKIDPSTAPSETYINVGSPTRSIRTATADTDGYLIVVGEGHKVGEETDTLQRYRTLADWAAQRFGATSIEYMWSTHDYDPVDGLPLIGPMTRATPHLMVATGFGRWGMTTGTVAAMVLSDHIAGRENPWASLFDPREHHVRGGTTTFVSENVKAILGHWVGDRLRTGSADLGELAPASAAVVRIDGEPVAAYRDEAGELHAVSAVCTHVGCLVRWNNAERTWDCPCHGSRFGVDGSVIGGPANRPLDQKHI